jgi:hypothetical protein
MPSIVLTTPPHGREGLHARIGLPGSFHELLQCVSSSFPQSLVLRVVQPEKIAARELHDGQKTCRRVWIPSA